MILPDDHYSLLEHVLFPPSGVNRSKLSRVLNDKNIVITGASYGIGESLALMLADTGAHLILVARTAIKLAEVKTSIENRGGKATVFAADLSRPDAVEALVRLLTQFPGGIDIVVSNAGRSIRRPLMESLDRHHDITRTLTVNFTGPTMLLLRLIPTLVQNKGQIISVSSAAVLLAPAPYWAAYQASKCAFDQWFRSAAPELNALGVATTTVYLPLVRTRMIEPTANYRKMPAMSPAHVSRIIGKRMIDRKCKYAPWWLLPAQVGSLLFGRLWHYWSMQQLKRKQSHDQRP